MKTIPTSLYAIYIIDANSGLPLVSKTFNQKRFDDDLISGMFKALESFINHLAYSSSYEQIREITFGNSIIVYERYGNSNLSNPLMGVLICKEGEDPKYLHSILNNVLHNFYYAFEDHLKIFRGNTRPFMQFDTVLDSIFSIMQNDSLNDKMRDVLLSNLI